MSEKKSIWALPIQVDEINERCKNTLSDFLKIEFTDVGKDFLKATMPIDERAMQPMKIMHGGASAALAETVASAAANYCIDQKKFVCVGLELNVNHIRAVSKGKITATAKPFHLGKTTQVWEIQIVNDEMKLVTVSRLTLCVIKKKSPP